jgi:hypothetical protein
MDSVHTLMANAIACFERVLTLLCNDPFHVTGEPSPGSVALIATVTAADEAAMQMRQDDVALERLADSIGARSGVAQVSFQFE